MNNSKFKWIAVIGSVVALGSALSAFLLSSKGLYLRLKTKSALTEWLEKALYKLRAKEHRYICINKPHED